MSLKNFHILFITVSVLLSVSFGIWAIYTNAQEPGKAYLLMGILSLILAGVLLIYGVWFLQKIKKLEGS